MSEDDPIRREAERFFQRYFVDQKLDDVNALGGLLRRNPSELYALQVRCMAEERKVLHVGRHFEGRRFGILARQLQKLAEQTDPR
ncbi:MAG: hypothetical protein HC869_14070 [Rhodospirillales bacterium]|nr:hypothetical protein [Rhodospirillales bacterium]